MEPASEKLLWSDQHGGLPSHGRHGTLLSWGGEGAGESCLGVGGDPERDPVYSEGLSRCPGSSRKDFQGGQLWGAYLWRPSPAPDT